MTPVLWTENRRRHTVNIYLDVTDAPPITRNKITMQVQRVEILKADDRQARIFAWGTQTGGEGKNQGGVYGMSWMADDPEIPDWLAGLVEVAA